MIERIHDLIWGPWLMVLFLGVGIFYTWRLKGFQLLRLTDWWRHTAGSLGKGNRDNFATACTALAATVGTGNIAGVATALAAGGPGAVFWMWVSAFVGMATGYGEVFLGLRYRYREKDGSFCGGPFVYLERGLKSKAAGLFYAGLCVLCSLGMGSMVQANSISESFSYSFSFPPVLCGLAVTFLAMAVIMGGIGRISEAAARLVPFSAVLYFVLCGIVLMSFFDALPAAFASIFKEAFTARSAAGGAAGFGVSQALRYGLARGVFSNEAGLGSLAVLHSGAGETTPEEQGMWAVFEVFFDTIISCTMTALVILCVTGASAGTGAALPEGSAMIAYCLSRCFGKAGGWLTAVSMALFAFATIIAWFYLGRQAAVYLTRTCRFQKSLLSVYSFLYLNAVFFGCLARLELVWNLSDIFNGLMAVPNLLGLLFLYREVKAPARERGKRDQGKRD